MNPLAHLAHYKLVLGSGSPRRKELLTQMGVDFEVRVSHSPEVTPPGYPLKDVPIFLAELKYRDLKDDLSTNEILITADTVVICEDHMLGKPKDLQEAIDMISFLSGKAHTVITGVTIGTAQTYRSASDTSSVTVGEMTYEEIRWYSSQYSIMDKAGAYGIQDWLGLCKVIHLQGSYYNVMGLPTHLVYEMLSDVVYL